MTLLKSFWRLYLLTLNRFYLLFWCFRSWLWTSKSRLRRKGKIELMFVILQNFTFKGNPFTLQADEAFYIGSSPATESYLVMEKILNVAKLSGAQVPLFRHPLLIGSPVFFTFQSFYIGVFSDMYIWDIILARYVMLCILYLKSIHKKVYNKKLINIDWLMLHSLQETKVQVWQ